MTLRPDPAPLRQVAIDIPVKAVWALFECPKPFIVLHGGRGSAKSHSVAQRLLIAAATESKVRILCVREVQKSIKESVHQLLKDYIDKWDPEQRDWIVTDKRIEHRKTKSFFTFVGLQEHTSDSIKSFEGYKYVWAEEAHSISKSSWTKLIPTILRNAGAKFFIVFNPDMETDYVYERFIKRKDPRAEVVEMNWRDNPWFNEEMEEERRSDKRLNTALYNHVWEGKCKSAEGLLFKRKWFKWYMPQELPDNLRFYAGSDYATAHEDGEDDDKADFTEHGIVGIDSEGEWWFRDWYFGQQEPAKWISAMVGKIKRWRPLMWFREKGVILRAVGPSMRRQFLKVEAHQFFKDIASAGSKGDRAMGFAAIASMRVVHMPLRSDGTPEPWADRLVNQLCSFTGKDGETDDAVDVCSIMARGVTSMINAPKKEDSDKDQALLVGSRRHREPRYEDEMAKQQRRDDYYR